MPNERDEELRPDLPGRNMWWCIKLTVNPYLLRLISNTVKGEKKSPFALYKLNLLSTHKIKRSHAIYYLWKKKEKSEKKTWKEKEQRKGRKKETFSCLLPHLSINTSAALTHFRTAESERSLMGITQRTAGSFWIFK